MNQRGVDVLVQAALRGQRQIRGRLYDGRGGRCAIGVLCETEELLTRVKNLGTRMGTEPLFEQYELRRSVACPALDCTDTIDNEVEIIVHLNDDHAWDFLTIARKLGEATA